MLTIIGKQIMHLTEDSAMKNFWNTNFRDSISFALATESVQPSIGNRLLLLQMIHNFKSEGRFVEPYMKSDFMLSLFLPKD